MIIATSREGKENLHIGFVGLNLAMSYFRYVQASASIPKDIVLVIDRSASMKKFNRMVATKKAAITVLNTLTPDDRIAVVAFSNQAFALGTQSSALEISSKNHSIFNTSFL